MALFSSDLLRNLFRVTTAAWISCWRVARAAAVECSAFCRKRCRAASCGTAPAPLSILLPSSALFAWALPPSSLKNRAWNIISPFGKSSKQGLTRPSAPPAAAAASAPPTLPAQWPPRLCRAASAPPSPPQPKPRPPRPSPALRSCLSAAAPPAAPPSTVLADRGSSRHAAPSPPPCICIEEA